MRAVVIGAALALVTVSGVSRAQPSPAPADDAGAPAETLDAAPVEPALPADPDAPTASASLDRTEAHVGDQLTLTVTAVAAAPIAATVKLPRPELGKFEILDSSQADQDLGDGRKGRRFVLQIAAYELGDLELPAIPVEYTSAAGTRTLKTTPIPVRIVKVVDDESAQLQPLAHTREVLVEDRRPLQALIGLGIFLGAVLLGLLARYLLRRRRRAAAAQAAAPAPRRPPHEVALERLAELRRRGHLSADAWQPFHFELAEIVRAFLGERFRFDSLELTTTELLEELAPARAATTPSGALSDQHFDRVRRLLEACDLVKFAKAPSSDPEALALLDEAEALVRALTEVAPPPTAATPPTPTTPTTPSTPTTPPTPAAPPSAPPSQVAHG